MFFLMKKILLIGKATHIRSFLEHMANHVGLNIAWSNNKYIFLRYICIFIISLFFLL